jgi:hypothetical protein
MCVIGVSLLAERTRAERQSEWRPAIENAAQFGASISGEL